MKKKEPPKPTELSSTTIPLPFLRSVFLKVHQYCSKSLALKKKKKLMVELITGETAAQLN